MEDSKNDRCCISSDQFSCYQFLVKVTFQKRVRVFHRGFPTREKKMEARGCRLSGSIASVSSVWKLNETRSPRFFLITFQQLLLQQLNTTRKLSVKLVVAIYSESFMNFLID